MNLEQFTQGQEPVDDSRLAALLEHNATVRDNWQVIAALKEAMQAEDYLYMAELWMRLPNTITDKLWLATTKGGIFTTKERELLKSNEAARGRTEYHQLSKEQVQ